MDDRSEGEESLPSDEDNLESIFYEASPLREEFEELEAQATSLVN